jgi:hypothetical protein
MVCTLRQSAEIVANEQDFFLEDREVMTEAGAGAPAAAGVPEGTILDVSDK